MSADTDNPVWCENCDSCIRALDGAKSEMPAYRWLCAKAPRPDTNNFVSRTYRITEVYYRCHIVNADGQCSRYEPRREATNDSRD